MPPVVLAVQTAFAAVLGKTLGIWVANAFLSTAFSVGVNMVLARKPQPASFETGTQTRLRTGSTLARQIIYGKAKTAGSLVYAVESTLTATNDKLWLVIALADHECEGLEAVYVNGRAVTLTSGVVTDYNEGSPATNYMKLRFYAGTSTQTADGALDAASTEWTSSHRGRGVCYVVLELLWNPDLYDSGIPDFEFLVKGRPLYDPRLDPAQPGGSSGGHAIATESTWEFTAGGVDIGSNPALQLYDYLRGIEVGSQRIGGMKIDADTITVAEVMAAANVCEESVSLAAGGTESRYLSGVVISTEATHRDNVQVIMAAMAGDLHDHGGRLRMFAGEARTPVLGITDDDIVRSVQYREKAEPQSWEWSKDSGRDERVNTVRGRYVAPTLLYRADEYPERTAASYLTADGGLELPGSLDLLAVQSKTQAQRLAEIYLRRSRWPGKLTFSGIPALVELESGDWVTVSSERQGWTGGSAKTFEVESTARHPTGHVRLVLQEMDSTIFDWSTSDEGTTAAAPSNPAPTLGASWPARFGSLAIADTIGAGQFDPGAINTADIAANAVTRGAPATADADRSTAAGITVEMVSITTGALVSGSSVDIAVDFASASLFGTAANIYVANATGGNVDVNLNLYRDYGGANESLLDTIPVRLVMPTGTNSTLTSATSAKFRVTDTSPADGALTYSVRLESEVTGGSPVSIDMAWSNLLRIMSYVERKA